MLAEHSSSSSANPVFTLKHLPSFKQIGSVDSSKCNEKNHEVEEYENLYFKCQIDNVYKTLWLIDKDKNIVVIRTPNFKDNKSPTKVTIEFRAKYIEVSF